MNTDDPEHRDALDAVAHGIIRFHTDEHPQPGFALPTQRGRLDNEDKHELEICWRSGLIEPLPARNLTDRINRERPVGLTDRGAALHHGSAAA